MNDHGGAKSGNTAPNKMSTITWKLARLSSDLHPDLCQYASRSYTTAYDEQHLGELPGFRAKSYSDPEWSPSSLPSNALIIETRSVYPRQV